MKTSLLQAQTLPDATPPAGKIQPFRKSLSLLNQYSNLYALQGLESLTKYQNTLFYDWKPHF